MRTKNNTKSAPVESRLSREEKIAELNRRFRKFEAASERLREAYDAAFADMDDKLVGIKKCASIASAQFNLMRKAMDPVKYDMTAGEYFYATEGGKEVFAVKVSKEQSCTLRVSARNGEEARKTALALVEADHKLLEDKGLVAEDVSR